MGPEAWMAGVAEGGMLDRTGQRYSTSIWVILEPWEANSAATVLLLKGYLGRTTHTRHQPHHQHHLPRQQLHVPLHVCGEPCPSSV